MSLFQHFKDLPFKKKVELPFFLAKNIRKLPALYKYGGYLHYGPADTTQNMSSLRATASRKRRRTTVGSCPAPTVTQMRNNINRNYIQRIARQVVSKSAETRNITVSCQSLNIGTAVATIHLTNIAEGDGEDQRSGYNLKVTGIYGKFIINEATVGPLDDNFLRITLWSHVGNHSSAANWDARSSINPQKYKVWWDKLVRMENTTTAAAVTKKKAITIKKSFKMGGGQGHKIVYNGPNANDTQTGDIHCTFICNENINLIDNYGDLKVYFKDFS